MATETLALRSGSAGSAPGTSLFDRVVVVDWSASSVPKRGRDSIWIATVDGPRVEVENVATRRECERRLHELLADGGGRRTLLGVDVSLGYPAGTAAAMGLAGPSPWRAMWAWLESVVVDDERNRNNRFRAASEMNRRITGGAGPFWGCPPSAASDALRATKPRSTREPASSPVDDAASAALPEWRATEAAMRADGHRPFAAWQLLGAGAVGSQSLLAIPVLERLRRAGAGSVHVWPFTTGLAVPIAEAGDIVVVEVWPSLTELPTGDDRVRDAVQVDATARSLADLDRRGRLAATFEPVVSAATERAVVDEEGWVLGAGPDPSPRGTSAGG